MIDHNDENLQHQAEHTHPGPRMSVVGYLLILFAVAFLLLLLAYFQQRRANAEAESHALAESASAVQSIQNLMEEKERLTSENTELETENQRLEQQIQTAEQWAASAEAQVAQQEKVVTAMDWLREIQGLYEKQYYRAARAMITEFETTDLPAFLPQETLHVYQEEDTPAPAQTYAAIKTALFPTESAE